MDSRIVEKSILSDTPDTQHTADKQFDDLLKNLQFIIQTHSHSQRALAKRVRLLIRVLLFGLISALAFILYLLYLLTMQVNEFADALDHITNEAEFVQTSIDNIEMSVTVFEAYMGDLPEMNQAITEIDNSLTGMVSNVSGVSQDVQNLGQELSGIRQSLGLVAHKVQVLDQSLLQINEDVDDAAKPFRRFNQMTPF